jgi:hypothetical protein
MNDPAVVEDRDFKRGSHRVDEEVTQMRRDHNTRLLIQHATRQT